MKKRFSFIILFLIFFLKTNFSLSQNFLPPSEKKACSNFYSAVKNDEKPFLKGIFPRYKYEDFGFYIKSTWDAQKKKYIEERDKNGNLKVGDIYSMKAFNSLRSEDSIIKINDKSIKTYEEFNEIIDGSIQKIKIELKDTAGENYLVYLDKHDNEFTYRRYALLDFNISELDLKKGFYEVTINHQFHYEYDKVDNTVDDLHEYVELGHKYLIGKFTIDDEKDFAHICNPTEKDIINNEINNPLDVTILNILRDDKDLQDKKFKIIPFKKSLNPNDALRIAAITVNVQRVKNPYNLKSFPFDKQTLKYTIVNNSYSLEQVIMYPERFSYEALNNFLKKDDIPGWEKKSFNIKKVYFKDTIDTVQRDGIQIEIELERKHGYYIFKVIFPIVLILIVCWSVVWINPKEIEARLTITIVCLLSLIAYNFVIDEELPKLEYLTVMDWIVLTSYVYATIPNFLSIYSFANRTSVLLTDKVDSLSKKFGLSSYLLMIIFIVFINANFNPENSSGLIGWMAFR